MKFNSNPTEDQIEKLRIKKLRKTTLEVDILYNYVILNRVGE